jgi:hypothetical protein
MPLSPTTSLIVGIVCLALGLGLGSLAGKSADGPVALIILPLACGGLRPDCLRPGGLSHRAQTLPRRPKTGARNVRQDVPGERSFQLQKSHLAPLGATRRPTA